MFDANAARIVGFTGAFAPIGYRQGRPSLLERHVVNASPDGFERPVIGINHQWPCPQIDVDVGDRLIVDVYNGLGNQSTGIHWHGFHQYMSGVMDGTSQVTQCPLPPGKHMRYDFQVRIYVFNKLREP